MIIGNREFDIENHTYIMGILNITPDSFSDGGKYKNMEDILAQTAKMIEEGAHIIDVGGESTRPGYVKISEEEEIERILPVVEKLKEEFDIPISLDTYKAGVAEAGIKAGVDLINDIWGLKYHKEMANVISKHDVCCCLMHNRRKTSYAEFLTDVKNDLRESLELAKNAGISPEKIIIDPGVGFAKTYEENLEILRNLKELKELKYPILLGVSRKSVIGLTLDVPVEERLSGTLATTALAVMEGCAFVRVHDIKENFHVIQMLETIKRGK